MAIENSYKDNMIEERRGKRRKQQKKKNNTQKGHYTLIAQSITQM